MDGRLGKMTAMNNNVCWYFNRWRTTLTLQGLQPFQSKQGNGGRVQEKIFKPAVRNSCELSLHKHSQYACDVTGAAALPLAPSISVTMGACTISVLGLERPVTDSRFQNILGSCTDSARMYRLQQTRIRRRSLLATSSLFVSL